MAESLSAKLFAIRVDLINAIDKHQGAKTERERDAAHQELRAKLAGRLRGEVAVMNLDNFLVRPKRRCTTVPFGGSISAYNRVVGTSFGIFAARMGLAPESLWGQTSLDGK